MCLLPRGGPLEAGVLELGGRTPASYICAPGRIGGDPRDWGIEDRVIVLGLSGGLLVYVFICIYVWCTIVV